jgi:hypothetical protein
MTTFIRKLLTFRTGLSRQTTASNPKLNGGLTPRHRGDAQGATPPIRRPELIA